MIDQPRPDEYRLRAELEQERARADSLAERIAATRQQLEYLDQVRNTRDATATLLRASEARAELGEADAAELAKRVATLRAECERMRAVLERFLDIAGRGFSTGIRDRAAWLDVLDDARALTPDRPAGEPEGGE